MCAVKVCVNHQQKEYYPHPNDDFWKFVREVMCHKWNEMEFNGFSLCEILMKKSDTVKKNVSPASKLEHYKKNIVTYRYNAVHYNWWRSKVGWLFPKNKNELNKPRLKVEPLFAHRATWIEHIKRWF